MWMSWHHLLYDGARKRRARQLPRFGGGLQRDRARAPADARSIAAGQATVAFSPSRAVSATPRSGGIASTGQVDRVQQAAGDAAEHRGLDAAVAVRAQDDQVGVDVARRRGRPAPGCQRRRSPPSAPRRSPPPSAPRPAARSARARPARRRAAARRRSGRAAARSRGRRRSWSRSRGRAPSHTGEPGPRARTRRLPRRWCRTSVSFPWRRFQPRLNARAAHRSAPG